MNIIMQACKIRDFTRGSFASRLFWFILFLQFFSVTGEGKEGHNSKKFKRENKIWCETTSKYCLRRCRSEVSFVLSENTIHHRRETQSLFTILMPPDITFEFINFKVTQAVDILPTLF